MKSLRSLILLEMATVISEADKSKILEKFGFTPALIAAFTKIDQKASVWFANIITNQFAKDNHIEGKSLPELVPKIDQNDLLIFVQQNIGRVNYVQDWLKSPQRGPENINLRLYNTLEDAYKASEDFHNSIATKATGEIKDETGKIIKTYPDFYWIDLQCNTSSAEAGAMGHCGADSRATTLYSLRDIKTKEPHVTIAYNGKNKTILQVKGKQNVRPVDKYMNYVYDLMRMLFNKNELKGFAWSHNGDLSDEDIRKAFPDKFDYINLMLSSDHMKFTLTDEEVEEYLNHYIDYTNINKDNLLKIRGLINRIMPERKDHREQFDRVHNILVLKNLKVTPENLIPILVSIQLGNQTLLEFVGKIGIDKDRFFEMLRTIDTNSIKMVINLIKGGFIYVFASGRNLSPEELYLSLAALREYQPEEDDRKVVLKRYVGDKISILKGTPFEAELLSKYPEIESDMAKVVKKKKIGEMVADEINKIGEADLYHDYMKRSLKPASIERPKEKKSSYSTSRSVPLTTTTDDISSKYNKIGNKILSGNVDQKTKQLITVLDKRQNDFFDTLKASLPGFDVKPKERNLYASNRTYEWTVTFKKYPLIVEHDISIIPNSGFFNVSYINKVRFDTRTYDANAVNDLITHKPNGVEIKKENGFLVYKLPLNADKYLTDNIKFTDPNKLGEMGKEFAAKVLLFNKEILTSFNQMHK